MGAGRRIQMFLNFAGPPDRGRIFLFTISDRESLFNPILCYSNLDFKSSAETGDSQDIEERRSPSDKSSNSSLRGVRGQQAHPFLSRRSLYAARGRGTHVA